MPAFSTKLLLPYSELSRIKHRAKEGLKNKQEWMDGLMIHPK